MAKTTSRYTYVLFGEEVKALCATALQLKAIDAATFERMTEKADALIGTQAKKAEYNKANPKKATAKGASEKTQILVDKLVGILSSEPMTTAEISEVLGEKLEALQVSNAMRYVPNSDKTKVIRTTTNDKGLTSQKEYTAYFIKADAE